MALGNTGGDKTFVTIVGGKWTIRVPEGTAGAVSRENKLGVEVHELQYSYVDGMIVDGRMKSGEYGTTLELDLQDDGTLYNVQIPVPAAGKIGDYFMSFGKCAPKLDATKKLFLGLGFDKTRQQPFLYLKQGGESIHSAFTKDAPDGMPQWEKKEVMGKAVWNADAQNEFLYGKIIDFLALVEDTEADAIDPAAEPF